MHTPEELITVEARWWARGTVVQEFLDWYRALGPCDPDLVRSDEYLLSPTDTTTNIKARDGATPLEVKRLRSRTPLADVVPDTAGWLERWSKRSITDEELATLDERDGTWLTVHKRRRIRHDPACRMELTDVRIGDDRWLTVALEADEGADALAARDGLVATLDRLRRAGLEHHIVLAADLSHGYPQHLLGLRAGDPAAP